MPKLEKAGYNQGDMSPKVEDYQRPMNNYSQEQFGKTLQYVERQNSQQEKQASGIKKQAYKGRYS
jgi:hypothetical protein